jgi:hypothetical protein
MCLINHKYMSIIIIDISESKQGKGVWFQVKFLNLLAFEFTCNLNMQHTE